MAKKKRTKTQRQRDAFNRCVKELMMLGCNEEVANLAAEMLSCLSRAEREQPRAMSTVMSCAVAAVRVQRRKQ
jgi:hypothetical protein